MNRILWEKWRDPVAPILRGKKPAAYEQKEDDFDPDFKSSISTFGFDEPDEDDDEDDGRNAGPCIVGPFGVIPMYESNLPSALFNFWMGHTTFKLTDDLVRAIEDVDGVESIDVFSPYRFRMAVGKAFDEGVVIGKINRLVSPPPAQVVPEKKAAGDELANLKAILSKSYKCWAIVFVPPKTYHSVGGKTADEVAEKLKRFAGAEKVIKSWEKA